MNHDSWLMSHPTSSTDSHFLNHLAYPSFTPLHNLHCSKKPWIVSHDSRVILPLIFLAEDGHTISPINLWKFHRNWSSHLRVYNRVRWGFLIFRAPDNHAPVGAWSLHDSWLKSYRQYMIKMVIAPCVQPVLRESTRECTKGVTWRYPNLTKIT